MHCVNRLQSFFNLLLNITWKMHARSIYRNWSRGSTGLINTLTRGQVQQLGQYPACWLFVQVGIVVHTLVGVFVGVCGAYTYMCESVCIRQFFFLDTFFSKNRDTHVFYYKESALQSWNIGSTILTVLPRVIPRLDICYKIYMQAIVNSVRINIIHFVLSLSNLGMTYHPCIAGQDRRTTCLLSSTLNMSGAW